MPRAKFAASLRLRRPPKSKPSNTPAPVNIGYRYAGKECRLATGVVIDPRAWDAGRARVKIGRFAMDGAALNSDLAGYLQWVLDYAGRLQVNGTEPTAAKVADAFALHRDGKGASDPHTAPNQLQSFWRRWMYTVADRTDSTRSTYRTTLNHVVEFDPLVTWEAINGDWLRRFRAHMTNEKHFKHNTVSKYISKLKTLLNAGWEERLHTNDIARRKAARVTWKRGKGIALREEDVTAITEVDLSDSPRLANARDLFLLHIWTGGRPRDTIKFGPENIAVDKDGVRRLVFTPHKTEKHDTVATVPIHPYIAHLTMPGKWPRAISAQNLNYYIKEVAERAGLTDIVRRKGCPDARRCDLVVNGSGRRTFATYMYRNDMPLGDLMVMTGHKTEKSLRTYLREDHKATASKIASHPAFNPPGS